MGVLPIPDIEDSSLLPGETKDCDADDQQSDNSVSYEENDELDLETQVVDVDVDVDVDDETQVMETQVMDDYDFDEQVHTQQINEDFECEGKRDDECSQVTQPLNDALDSIGFQFEDTRALGEMGTTPDNVSQSSGSLKRGFASVRTASLQAAGLTTRRTASKIVDDRSRGTVLSNLSSDLHSLDNIGFIENSEKVGVENEMTKCDEEGSTDGDRSDVARSLARKLFTEEDAIEVESDTDISDRRKDLSQFPSCDDNLAGLSYVDSQEPGELSQVNALEFVDRFLKFNMFESDQGVLSKTGAVETRITGSISRGARSIAQKTSHRSTLAEPSIYEWDDKLEDEGGGEFFTKKKEVLLGHNSCPRPRSSQPREPRVCRSVGKLRNEKGQQAVHDTIMGLHSDLKSVNGGEKGKAKRRAAEENVCSDQHLEALPNVQSVDIQNVGIDTQMAAEAMEALSTGSALMNNGNCVTEQGHKSENARSEKESVKDGPTNQSSHQKRACFSTSGVVTRSRAKRIIMTSGHEPKCHSTLPQIRRRSIMGKLDVSRVKPNKKQKRSSVVVNRREELDTVPVSVGAKRKESILVEQLNADPPRQLRRQSFRGRSSILAPAAEEVVHCVESPDDTFRFGEAVHETRSKKRKCVVSENCNTRKEDADIATTVENDMVDGSHYKTMKCSPRWTRSRTTSVKGTECSRDEKGLLSSRLLSSEDASQLSSKKQDTSTPPPKGTLASTTVDVTSENMKKSSKSSDVTPVHLKTSTSTVSPICIGDGYQTPSCKRRLSLQKECIGLSSNEISSSPSKGLRQRRDKNTVRVLFSQHLDGDIVRHQKKILYRLGVSVASTISEATHFVADSFLRTRNMLEAIASGKPVVTHFWIESCGQANCIVDEKKYILRDATKEKELSFSMPKSLAHASRYPLLEGKRVLITPNVKPGKEVISSLVKAVRGQAVERLGRSISNNDMLLDDLLVLSCEEDLGVSEPLLEKGIAVYSSELLLNGIITQRLEYERYRLFVSHVKKTRSTLWLKKGEQIFPVTKIK